MKTMWSVAWYEFKIQHRSLAFWLIVVGLSAFLFGEVLQGISSEAGLAAGQNFFLVQAYGTEAQATMKITSFSIFQAWGISDLLGLMSALLIGVLGAFVWQKDRRLMVMERLSTLPFRSWQYVLGKYLGVVLSWGVIVTPLAVIGVIWTYVEANRYGLPFVFADFPAPLIGWMLLSLAYGTVFVMASSLLVRNGIGTLLIYFVYWGYCVMDVKMLRGASTFKLLTYWLIRSGYSMTRENLGLVQARLPDLWLNRGLYLSLVILLLCLTIWVFNQIRRRGTLIGLSGDVN